MEGVLTPEIWIAVAERTGIPELRRTTRDEPDYDRLMRGRLAILDQHGLKLSDIDCVLAAHTQSRMAVLQLCEYLGMKPRYFDSTPRRRCWLRASVPSTEQRTFGAVGREQPQQVDRVLLEGVLRLREALVVEQLPGAAEVAVVPFKNKDGDGEFALVIRPSNNFFDGRGANKPWLQELPDPVTKISWSSWVEIHPETAAKRAQARTPPS